MSSTFHILPARFRAYLRHPKVRAAWLSFFWGAVLVYFLFAALVLTTRWILLPQVDKYKDDIARFLGEALHAEVSIGRVSPRWDTFWPQLSLRDVVIERPDPRSTDANILHLPQVEASFYWRSVLGQPIFRKLEVPDAEITVRHVGEGVFDIAGFIFDLNNRPQAKSSENGSQGTDWLLQQGRIDVTSCTVRYVDLIARPRPRTTTLENINFSFDNSVDGYRAGLQGELAGRHNNRIDIRTRFTAPFFGDRSWKTWSGELFVGVDNLDVARLTRPIAGVRKILKRGRGSTRAWMEFQDGTPTNFTGFLGLSDVILTLAENAEPLRVRQLSTKLTETLTDGELNAKAESLSFELVDGTFATDMQLETMVLMDAQSADQSKRSGFRIAELDVETLKKLLPSVPFPEAAAELIRKHDASGTISDFEVSWAGTPGSTSDWRIRTNFEELSVAPALASDSKAVFTGFGNLSGSAEITAKSGRVDFLTSDATVSLPGVFENPQVTLNSLTGGVAWQLAKPEPDAEEKLTLTFDHVALVNDDASVTANGFWKQTESRAGEIDLSGTVVRAQADKAWRYMPLVISKNVRNWLQGGLVAGQAKNGTWELKGDLSLYPWVGEHKGKGHFIVTAELDNAALDYVPSMKVLADGQFERASQWPLLTDIKGQLTFEGASMTVLANSARTGGAAVTSARADIPDLRAKQNTRLIIDGKAEAELQKFFDYVEASPVTKYVSGAFTGTKAEGRGTLDLHLDIPLLHAADTKVNGSISMSGANIAMGWPKPPLRDVEGTVHFFERGARASNVHARPFGSGDTSVSVHTTDDGSIVITAAGQTDVKNLTWFAQNEYFEPVVSKMSGTMPFVSTVVVKKGSGVTVSARSSLEGVAINLPAPLNKRADQAWDTSFSFTPVTLNKKEGYLVKVGSGSRFDVLLQMPKDGSTLPLLGDIAVGSRAGLPARGISVTVNTKKLRLMDWQPFVQKMFDTAKAQDQAQLRTAAAGAADSGAGLSEIEVKADELILEDGTIHDSLSHVKIDPARDISVTLSSKEVQGRVRYESAGRGRVTGSFERLHLSAKAATTIRQFLQGESIDVVPTSRPTELPSLDLVADELIYDGRKIGRMVLQADASGTADKETLVIKNFAVLSDVTALTGSGSWTQGRRLAGEQTGQTDFRLKLSTKDLGQTLSDLKFEDLIENTTGTAEAHLMFKGLPWAPQLDTLTGSYSLDLRKGNFAKVDTGAHGLLVSFLSFQSLFKRLTLDFSDFKSGFAFDTFTGSAIITDGVISTDNTKLVGTHGTILLSGNTNVAEGSIDTRVIVLPEINAGNASLALAFVNPAVGIGSFLAQLVLRTPLSHLFKVEYEIKGPWKNPTFTKISGSEKKAETD